MVRRAVLIASVLGVVSAAGALAFARELTRAARALVLTPWTGGGFTPVPLRTIDKHSSMGALPNPAMDSVQGAYCRFRPKDDNTYDAAADAELPLGPGLDSTGLAKLRGQSIVSTEIDRAAMCSGDSFGGTAPRSLIP